jgi:hypothetical protein
MDFHCGSGVPQTFSIVGTKVQITNLVQIGPSFDHWNGLET